MPARKDGKARQAGAIAPLSQFYRERSLEPGRRKGERTRDALKASTADLLEKAGYLELRVGDICDGARVSNALFYLYFKNKTEITYEILVDFLNIFGNALQPPARARNRFESIYWTTLTYTERFAAQPGLMRCLLQFSDELPQFGKLRNRWSQRWLESIVATLRERGAVDHASDAQLHVEAVALGAMVDGFLRNLYVERDQIVLRWAAEAVPSAIDVAELLSRLWYRAVFGRNPLPKEVAAARLYPGTPRARAPRLTPRGGIRPARAEPGR
jgi:AcrR family transcriptional regulator